ncbi:MAG: DUF115 domain-containing protein [Spirochaetia bacterium]|nr:DUF115 domain-containing protein [Spirochaetia bacterium]
MNIPINKFKRYLKNNINKFSFHERRWSIRERLRLLKFDNTCRDEECVILGNGPSLHGFDFNRLKGKKVFALNKFYLAYENTDFRASYHVIVNRFVIEQSKDFILNLNYPVFLSYDNAGGWLPKKKNIYYIRRGGFYLDFQPHPYFYTCEGYTVTYVALQLAYWMGFKTVYLLGVDHNFIYEGKPNEEMIMNGDDINHFHPGYFKNQKWQNPDLEASEAAYSLANFIYTRGGRRIYNATEGTKLDIFPKIDIETFL